MSVVNFERHDLTHVHTYRDRNGSPMFYRARFQSSKEGKTFRPLHVDEHGDWRRGEPKIVPKPLYRLPELHSVADGVVFIVEGELCADRLAALGLTVTTSGSATSAAACDWTPLRDRSCVVWPDNDEPGQRYGAAVADALAKAGAADIRLVDIQVLGLNEHGDCVDWLAANPAALATEVLRLPSVAPETHGPKATLTPASAIECRPINWLWRGWLACGKFCLLAGAPGVGKSTVAMNFAAIVSCGGKWPDGSIAPSGNVLIWSGEDSPDDTLVPRLRAAGANLERVFFVDGVADTDGSRAFDPASDIGAPSVQARRLGNVALIVCDPVVARLTADSHKTLSKTCIAPLVDLPKVGMR